VGVVRSPALATAVRSQEPAEAETFRIRLLDGWTLLRRSEEIRIRTREQRLLAVLALQGSRPRSYLAGLLWPESSEPRALANLRAAVWRIVHSARGLLYHDRSRVALTRAVCVDVDDMVACAERVTAWDRDRPCFRDVPAVEYERTLTVLACGDLLPGWRDDWVVYERTRLQQLRLRSLEVLADLLLLRGDAASALTAARSAAIIEPLHESAHRAVIRVHLADGNHNAARREYDNFRGRMLRELGIPPSKKMEALIRPLSAAQSRRWVLAQTVLV
jgi:DNA-binding SARP family transcriptional activator